MTTGRINQVTRQIDTRENTGEVLQENNHQRPGASRFRQFAKLTLGKIWGKAQLRDNHPRPGASRFSKRLSKTRFARQPTNFNCPLTSQLLSVESNSWVGETKSAQQTRRDGYNLLTVVRLRVTVHAGVAPHPGTECNNSLSRKKSEPNTKSPQKVRYPTFANQMTDQQTTLFSSSTISYLNFSTFYDSNKGQPCANAVATSKFVLNLFVAIGVVSVLAIAIVGIMI